MANFLAVRIILQAISPLLAMRIFLIMRVDEGINYINLFRGLKNSYFEKDLLKRFCALSKKEKVSSIFIALGHLVNILVFYTFSRRSYPIFPCKSYICRNFKLESL